MNRYVDHAPVPAAVARDLAARARRLFVKAGKEILRFDQARQPISEVEVDAYLVHEDGCLRVPVLVAEDVLVRGYTEELYDEALAALETTGTGRRSWE